MNGTVLWIIAAAAVLLGVAAIGLFLSRARLREKIAALEAGTVALEARLLHATGRAAAATSASRNETGAPTRTRKEVKDDEKRQQELLSVRRDLAAARDEARKAQAEVRAREAEVREAREKTENALYVLREENKRLLEQLREKETAARTTAPTPATHDAARTRAAPAPHVADGRDGSGEPDSESVRELKRELSAARSRLSDVERRDARDDARLKEAIAKLGDAERELRRFREAASLEGGKVLDPVLYVRWRERALEGRRMYRMMRQLRDLSDLKLTSYQAAVERLASAFLATRGAPPHDGAGTGTSAGAGTGTRAGSSRADVLLRAALEHLPPPHEVSDAEFPEPESTGAARVALTTSVAAVTPPSAT